MYSWTRKASTCGFHLLPVPVDPFALPQAPESDPLRGPIFVPMNISCLTEGNKPLFNGKKLLFDFHKSKNAMVSVSLHLASLSFM